MNLSTLQSQLFFFRKARVPSAVTHLTASAQSGCGSAPGEDQMSKVASESGLLSSGEEDEAMLPPSVVGAHAESDSEFTAMLGQASTGIGLEWDPPPCLGHLQLD